MTASWNLKEPLGNWKSNHSKHGIWKAYMSHPFVYEHVPAHNSWNVYYSINFQLLLETSIPFDQFDRSNAIPIAIRSFSDSFYYSEFTATIIPNPNSPIHGPILSWESLISKQPS